MMQKRDAIIAENVSLIRSIPEKYFTEVESMVFRSIAKGGDRKQLADEIEREFWQASWNHQAPRRIHRS